MLRVESHPRPWHPRARHRPVQAPLRRTRYPGHRGRRAWLAPGMLPQAVPFSVALAATTGNGRPGVQAVAGTEAALAVSCTSRIGSNDTMRAWETVDEICMTVVYRYSQDRTDRRAETPVDEHNHALAALR